MMKFVGWLVVVAGVVVGDMNMKFFKNAECTGTAAHEQSLKTDGTCYDNKDPHGHDHYVTAKCDATTSTLFVYEDAKCTKPTHNHSVPTGKCAANPHRKNSSSIFTCPAPKKAAGDDWVNVPGGMVIHKDCMFEVPNGGVVEFAAKCEHGPARQPNRQIYAMDAYYTAPGSQVQKQMNASWTVPSLPSSRSGQTVYFWPGFKSTSATMMLPVLQPVLQYGQQGASWYLQSWFVWGSQGISYTAPAISVSPGDVLTSYMEHTGTQWTVYGRDTKTGRDSNLHVTDAKVHNTEFKIAHICCETIMRRDNDCAEYPASGTVKWTGITLEGQSRHFQTREQMHDCDQKVDFSGTDLTMTFKSK